MFKVSFRRLLDALVLIAIGYMLYQKVPGMLSRMNSEGKSIGSFATFNERGEKVTLPVPGKKQILIFWATWCGPCAMELRRFQAAIKEGQLHPDEVLAVSIGEEPGLVYKETHERGYRFTVLADPEQASFQSLAIEGTPTIYHVNADGTIAYASTGSSFFPVWRAKSFLN